MGTKGRKKSRVYAEEEGVLPLPLPPSNDDLSRFMNENIGRKVRMRFTYPDGSKSRSTKVRIVGMDTPPDDR